MERVGGGYTKRSSIRTHLIVRVKELTPVIL
jgi:hypothetical protein